MIVRTTAMRDVTLLVDRFLGDPADVGQFRFVADCNGLLALLGAAPEPATLPETVRADLRALARAPRVHAGVVSGRALAGRGARVDPPEGEGRGA